MSISVVFLVKTRQIIQTSVVMTTVCCLLTQTFFEDILAPPIEVGLLHVVLHEVHAQADELHVAGAEQVALVLINTI